MKYISYPSFYIDISTLFVAVVVLIFLFSSQIRKSTIWNAIVTPLASIIGSGFLIVAPLLWMLAGYAAPWVLFGVILVAYAIGSVIRYNIEFVEPHLKDDKDKNFKILNNISYLALALSYFISVTFYIRILSAFALKNIFVDDIFLAKMLTSILLFCIGLIGFFRGFDRLELLEVFSVNIKISIIVMLLLGLFLYDWNVLDFSYNTIPKETSFSFLTLRKIFGTLLVVQGFEISRYIGHKYSTELRVKTMKLAQIISSLIYLIFIFLILYLMDADQKVTETSIIDLTRKVSPLLPIAVMIGAIFSQFSAAIADTIGCGGIITEYSRNRVSRKEAYFFISLCCIVLVWVANVFEIVAIASRMFAGYYFTQCMEALYANHYYKYKSTIWSFYYVGVGFMMLLIFIFGIPAE